MADLKVRVGIIFPSKDPVAPNQWSGTPSGLKDAFQSIGAEVVPIGHFFPPVLRLLEAAAARLGSRRWAVVDRSGPRVRARRWSFQRQLDRAGRLDMVVAMVTEGYHLGDLRLTCPVVTYSDSTLQQMQRHPESDIANGGFPARAVRRWIATERNSIRAADVACVATAWAGRSIVEDYGVPPTRVQVVGMGHRPRRSRGGVRDWTAPSYLFIGVDWRRKNGDRVLNAFRQIHEEIPEARLHLVGEHELVVEEGVVDHGLLHRNDPQAQLELDQLFTECTVFVLPSLFEPFGIAYFEAASAGIPVIATSEGGGGGLLGGGAIVVDPEDDSGLLRAMRLLASPDIAQSMGTAAADIAAQYTWTAVAERLVGAATRP